MRSRLAVFAGTGAVALTLVLPHSLAAQQADSTRAASPASTRWVVDLVHSQVEFRVRHLIGWVRGSFTDWYASLTTTSQDWNNGTVKVTVQTGSLNTGNSYRDKDLRSSRFFAVDSFPQMTFEGTAIAGADSTLTLAGTLTIKGKTRPVTLTGQYLGIAKDREGHERIAFDAATTVDRRDYGISYNEMVAGNPLVGNEVQISIAIEAVRIN
jgi:polyisoprenoid-binding protein YceI